MLLKTSPAPWFTVNTKNSILVISAPFHDNYQDTIAEINLVPRSKSGRAEGNAKLITAAPELLAIVKRFLAEKDLGPNERARITSLLKKIE